MVHPELARRLAPASFARGRPPARKRTTPSNPLRAPSFAIAAGLAVATTFAAPASALALDLDALRSTLAENNKDILRMSDPERFLNPAEIELESELGPPRDPVTPPGVNPGEEGERDVVTLPSGLSYADVELGRGEPLKVADLVVAHVVGTLPDGTEFENTYRRGTAPPHSAARQAREGLGGHREHARGQAATIAVPPSLGFGNAIRAPLGRVPAGAARGTRCSCSDAYRRGKGMEEKNVCTDEKYPCDPLRG